MGSNMAIQILLSGSLSILWGLINALQMIVHMPFLNIIIPVNAKLVYDMLYEMATFDIIPTEAIYQYA